MGRALVNKNGKKIAGYKEGSKEVPATKKKMPKQIKK